MLARARVAQRGRELGVGTADVGNGLHAARDGAGDRPRGVGQLGDGFRERVGFVVERVLRVLEVDPDSRVPERRVTLTPYPEGGDSYEGL